MPQAILIPIYQFEKLRDEMRIKVTPRLVLDVLDGILSRPCLAIRPV